MKEERWGDVYKRQIGMFGNFHQQPKLHQGRTAGISAVPEYPFHFFIDQPKLVPNGVFEADDLQTYSSFLYFYIIYVAYIIF